MKQGWNTVANWVNGLVGAFIGAASNSITLIIIDPEKFSPSATGGWKGLGLSVLIGGAVGAALYLKQNPTPFKVTSDETTDIVEDGQPQKQISTHKETSVEPKG
jgi:hypothetical protein